MKVIELFHENLLITCMLFILLISAGCTENHDIKPVLPLGTSIVESDENITIDEVASLMYMVEEEKLAMDVYNEMLKLYELNIFNNINQSEKRHVAAITSLIVKYELDNPIDGNLPGEFENKEIQQLYNDLIELGNTSKIQAMNVGLIIEKKDIKDIQHYLDCVVVQEDIALVYNNLLSGSINHLNAFMMEVGE